MAVFSFKFTQVRFPWMQYALTQVPWLSESKSATALFSIHHQACCKLSHFCVHAARRAQHLCPTHVADPASKISVQRTIIMLHKGSNNSGNKTRPHRSSGAILWQAHMYRPVSLAVAKPYVSQHKINIASEAAPKKQSLCTVHSLSEHNTVISVL